MSDVEVCVQINAAVICRLFCVCYAKVNVVISLWIMIIRFNKSLLSINITAASLAMRPAISLNGTSICTFSAWYTPLAMGHWHVFPDFSMNGHNTYLYQVVNKSHAFSVHEPTLSSTHGIGISITDEPILSSFIILISTIESVGMSSNISTFADAVILSVSLNFIGSGVIVTLSTWNFVPPVMNEFNTFVNFSSLLSYSIW